MIRPTTLLAAAALVVVPATASADRPANPGQQGRDNAAAHQQDHGPRPGRGNAPASAPATAAPVTSDDAAAPTPVDPASDPAPAAPTTEPADPTAPAAPTEPATPPAPAKPKSGKGKAKGHAKGKAVAFTLHGLALTGLDRDADGALTGPLTLDPTAANRAARTLLDLTEGAIDADTTVTFGEAGDAVAVRYVGLSATDALDPSDEVHVTGRVRRATRTAPATLDLTRIVVVRPDTTDEED